MKRALDQMKRVFDLCSTAGMWEGVLVLVLVLEESERARARARERERERERHTQETWISAEY